MVKKLKVIIAGNRDINDYNYVILAIKKSGFDISEVVSGCAPGVDSLGERWARENNIPVKRFPAEWEKYGKVAGPLRNQKMAEYADALLLVWNSRGAGSFNMLQIAKKKGLIIYEHRIGKAAVADCQMTFCFEENA
jgi:hypothetical protein